MSTPAWASSASPQCCRGRRATYDTDAFTPILRGIGRITGAAAYTGKLEDLKDIAYRVVADHIRTLTFALTDGATIGNEGRAYVLKRILPASRALWPPIPRRDQAVLCDLVGVVVEVMGQAFPELHRIPDRVAAILRDEEESFVRTLDRGLTLFKEAVSRSKLDGIETVRGEDAFMLHDTYGVYIDITEQMASEIGFAVDRERFETLLQEAKEKSRQGSKTLGVNRDPGGLAADRRRTEVQGPRGKGKILAW